MGPDQLKELVEKVIGIMRSRTGFGVVLYGKNWFVPHPHPGYRIVVQVQVRNLQIGVGLSFLPVYRKTVVLGSNLAFSG